MSGQNLCLGERKGRALKETAAVVLSIVSNRRDMSALSCLVQHGLRALLHNMIFRKFEGERLFEWVFHS